VEGKPLSCLGIVTARGGSKGVRNKNGRPIGGGASLVERAVDVGLNCPSIDEVAITTDSEALAAQAQGRGAIVPFLRPVELSSDLSKQEDAILHLMNWYEEAGKRFDQICLLTPTNAFRTAATLNAAFERLVSRPDATAIVSLMRAPAIPDLCNTWDADAYLADFPNRASIFLNRQEFPPIFTVSGVVYISQWGTYKEHRTIWQPRTIGFAVGEFEALDIDTPLDFFLADQLVRDGVAGADDLRGRINDETKP
jgi:CMP-N-acetylneuraminic acid synthetase